MPFIKCILSPGAYSVKECTVMGCIFSLGAYCHQVNILSKSVLSWNAFSHKVHTVTMYIICPGACSHYKHILFRCIYIVIKSIFFASQIYARSQMVHTVIKCVPYTHLFSKRTLSLNALSHPVHCHQIHTLTAVHIIIKLLSQKVHIAIQMYAYSLQVYAVIKYTLSASPHRHQMHAHSQ